MTKQRRYIESLGIRIMDYIRKNGWWSEFDKAIVSRWFGFDNQKNAAEALRLLFKRGRISRVRVGCRNADGDRSGNTIYVRKENFSR